MYNCILEVKNITKTFPGVVALNRFGMEIRRGEVHALVGENGSGKSTLIKILFGIYKADEGEVFLNGQRVHIRSTIDAMNMGISVIFQEFNLISSLSVSENIFLGRLIKNKKGDINWKEVNNRAKGLLDSLDFNINPNTLIEDLSVAEKQMVEIAKAVSVNSNIIFMDEPSATLTDKELKKLFNIIDKLKNKGVTIVYISHRLEEIFKICDRVTIIRDGLYIDTLNVVNTTKAEIIQKMVGRSIDMEFPKRNYNAGEVLLKVENLNRKGKLKDISFTLNKGEILGVAGLVGAGRTELARALFGADKIDTGDIYINKSRVKIGSTKDAKQLGIALVPEDRKVQGLLLKFSVLANTTLANLKGVLLNRLMISHKKEKEVTSEYITKLKIKTPSSQQQVLYLSGGNQQKVVLSKWLFSDSDILLLDEPTRGIDVGAKYEIYLIMDQLVQQGKSIIMISSELPEVIAMSDRILVMHEGEIKAELGRDEATPETIMQCAIG